VLAPSQELKHVEDWSTWTAYVSVTPIIIVL